MLRSVSVKNYKAIGPGELNLELAPITILVGKNGTGKSSVLEAIALTAQSALADRNQLELILSGTLVDIPHEEDSGRDLIGSIYYRKNSEQPLSVGVEIDVQGVLLLEAGESSLTKWLNKNVNKKKNVAGYRWTRLGENRTSWEHAYSVNKKPLITASSKIEKETVSGYSSGEFLKLHWLSEEALRGAFRTTLERVLPGALFTNLDRSFFNREDDSLDKEFEALKFVGEAVLDVQFRDALSKVGFLSSLRGRQLIHREVGPEVRFTGKHGEMTIRLLANIQTQGDKRLGILREWAENFGLNEFVAAWAGQQLLNAQFSDASSGTRLVLDAAASGSVNGLMLAAQLLFSPEGACLLIEEPEVSMNPGFERKLPGLFVESVRQGHQVIAATHSEVLIAAMGNAVRLKLHDLKPDEVAIYELSRDGEKGVTAERLNISDRGYLDRWVTSFSEAEQGLFHEWAESLPEARDEASVGYAPAGRVDKGKRAPRKPRRATKKRR